MSAKIVSIAKDVPFAAAFAMKKRNANLTLKGINSYNKALSFL